MGNTRSALKQKEEELKSVKNRLIEIETFYKEKLQEARSALKQKEEELKSVKDSKSLNSEDKSSCQRCEQHEREHKESMTEMETFYKKKLHEARSALKQKEEELKSVRDSLTEMETLNEEKLHEARSALKQKEEELKSFKDRMAAELEEDTKSMNIPVSQTPAEIQTHQKNLYEARSALNQKEEELKLVRDRMTEMERLNQEKLQEARSSLKQKEEELKSFRISLTDMERLYQGIHWARSSLKQKEEELKSVKNRMTEMERLNQEKLHEARSALKQEEGQIESLEDRLIKMCTYQKNLYEARSALTQKDQELKSLKDRMTEMETLYKEKLHEARSALKQKDEELKSVRDRVAPDLTLSIKTGDTESMNNPVSKTKLTEMYNKLKLLQWPKIKDHLKSNAVSREFTRDLTQKMFKDAAEEMERKKKQIDEVFGLIENSSGLTPQKVKEFRQLTIHSLQMNLHHSRKEDLLQSPFLDDEAQYSQDVMENFRLLASECYWLGCLMALNNPPLQPDWENHVPGMDAWDIFPRNIKSV
ncbi:putative leucine-rich repeat-containing protein DDB_G0290503 isoform X6 [Lates calcarifer]|uniref:Leucine-rich repeat-containing protein DDB_G0290503 isoform X6 n=1 Tax=Lates calcarifer TaxID=8187 RepID=A0AAJ8DMQ3_LATCA|nr:putative leucine-rich repeat-containing protein DDB_G0290503 isoform X6 [Lates calcarifer]